MALVQRGRNLLQERLHSVRLDAHEEHVGALHHLQPRAPHALCQVCNALVLLLHLPLRCLALCQ